MDNNGDGKVSFEEFVDYFRVDERRIGFYLADVSGHGASSAFVTGGDRCGGARRTTVAGKPKLAPGCAEVYV